ncbi:nitroreductase family protein [bacterium]|nr:nitroreductase family protein [bacterium]
MLEELIENRCSTRKYQDKQIPKDILMKILKAGYLAPSWMNSQPWKFILVQNQETKALLSELAGFQPHVKTAPSVVVAIADKNAWKKEEFSKVLKARGMQDEGIEKVLSVPMFYPVLLGENMVLARCLEQVTYAISYMMLQAQELGVSSCVIGAIHNQATIEDSELTEKANKILNLDKDEIIITMLTLGYSAQEKPQKIRKDINSIIHFEKVGQNIG